MRIARALAVVALSATAKAQQLPIVTVTQDDTLIDRSCRVVIVSGRVIADANGDGVVHIKGDGLTVEFMGGSMLQGADLDARPDTLSGLGIRIDGAKKLTLKNARVRGYKVGIYASNAAGLTIDTAEVTDCWRQHLKSTAAAEDGGDWLWPHKNDANEWMINYGGAVVVEDTDGATVRKVKVRRGQNGVILDRVSNSKVYDNDCSFLSGWGLAMWRCRDNQVTRNAFDFCVRGYSHGVYNRGQDSAGILFFEQNHGNVIAENSATHGGDGFFGFGGREALGEEATPGFDHRRAGNVGNLIVGNDFSYAPAHGIELTFSFDNRIIDNRLASNAICGIWGGYSQDTLIAGNVFESNGEMAYGLERGGVNIEHGAGNRMVGNTFRNNACGVHLWWDNDEGLLKLPWAGANDRGGGSRKLPSTDNTIAENNFEGDRVGIHLRECDRTFAVNNHFSGVEKEVDATGRSELVPPPEGEEAGAWDLPEYEVHGGTKPVGAREKLRGRDKIVMTEWGPWDHQSPMVRLVSASGDTHLYEAWNLNRGAIKVRGVGVVTTIDEVTPTRVTIRANEPGVFPYVLSAAQGEFEQESKGTIVNASWDVVFFPWPKPDPAVDEGGVPRVPPDLEGWRALAGGREAVRTKAPRLAFRHGMKGPSESSADESIKAAAFKSDYFGMIARTHVPLRAGRWRITTQSDDGVRVLVDGKAVIENWTHHGPARDTGEFTLDGDRGVEIVVEHFEIMGFSVLEVDLERAP